MQNPHVDDLVNGSGQVEGYSKTIYIRKDDVVRAKKLGYELIEEADATKDMSFYGLPESKENTDVEKDEATS